VRWAPPDFDGDIRPCSPYFLAWAAYNWPAPGSDEAMRLMAAWASVKFVTFSGVVCRVAALPCHCPAVEPRPASEHSET